MARFGRSFVQAATQPQYAQGLFTAAQQMGAAPGRRRAKEEQQKRVGMLRDMGAVERADYMASIAETPQELMQAEAAKAAAVKQGSLESLRGLEAARQAAGSAEEKQQIEQIMARVAVQAGVDPVTIAGRTQEEELRETRLEEVKANQQKRLQTERSKNVVAAWSAMSEADRVKFKDQLPVDDQLLIDNAELQDLERQKRVEEIEAWKVSKDAPLPVASVEAAINNLTDGDVKSALKTDLAAIVEQLPTEGKEYSYAGQRSKLASQIKAINDKAFRATVAEDSARIADERFDRSTIRQVEADIATYRPTKAQVEAKAQELRDKKDVEEGTTFVEPKIESFMAEAEKLLIQAYKERQKGRLKVLIPSYEESEEVSESFTEEQEQLITANMSEYGKTREEVITALKQKGRL